MNYYIIIVKRILLFSILYSVLPSAYGQNIVKRIGVVSGGQIEFAFNSYSKIESGISYPSITKLQIYFDDISSAPGDPRVVNVTSAGYTVLVKALSASIVSDDGVATLDLDEIRITPSFLTPIDGDESHVVVLSAGGDWLVKNEGTPGGFDKYYSTISLQVDCAKPGGLMNKTAGYYYVDLEFSIVKN